MAAGTLRHSEVSFSVGSVKNFTIMSQLSARIPRYKREAISRQRRGIQRKIEDKNKRIKRDCKR